MNFGLNAYQMKLSSDDIFMNFIAKHHKMPPPKLFRIILAYDNHLKKSRFCAIERRQWKPHTERERGRESERVELMFGKGDIALLNNFVIQHRHIHTLAVCCIVCFN